MKYQKIGSTVSTQCKLNGFRVISLKFGRKSKKLAESGLPGLPFLGSMLNVLFSRPPLRWKAFRKLGFIILAFEWNAKSEHFVWRDISAGSNIGCKIEKLSQKDTCTKRSVGSRGRSREKLKSFLQPCMQIYIYLTHGRITEYGWSKVDIITYRLLCCKYIYSLVHTHM